MSHATATLTFLHGLFPDLQGHHALLWTAPGKLSRWETAFTDETRAFLDLHVPTQNLYVGAGLAAQDYGPHLRCKAEEITAIGGLWLDLDYGPGTKKGAAIPPTIEDATWVMEAMGLPPSAVVHTGHGLQAWWWLKELWVFDTPEERQQAATLIYQWNRTAIEHAKTKKWCVDNVGDLARVMRLPGTTNHKGVPVPSTLASLTDLRYDPLDFEDYLITDTIQPHVPTVKFDLMYSVEAEPPAEAFALLMEAEPKFRKAWEQVAGLKSQSEYDLSLASQAYRANWTSQHIVNLLIANRRKHGSDLKLRDDYYTATLNAAGHQADGFTPQQRLDNALAEEFEKTGKLPEAVTQDRTELFRVLSSEKFLNVPITNCIKYQSDQPTYVIGINGTDYSFGFSCNLLTQGKFRERFFDVSGLVVPQKSHKAWHNIIQYLSDSASVESVGEEGFAHMSMRQDLLEFFEVRPPYGVESSWEEAAMMKSSFQRDNGDILFSASTFSQYLESNGPRMKYSVQVLAPKLKACGCHTETLQFRLKNDDNKSRQHQRFYWRFTP